MPSIQEFLQGLSRFNQGVQGFNQGMGPDPNNPMSFGMDMPEQGGFAGNMQIPPPMMAQAAPQSGPPAAEGPGIFSNPVLNPTVDPSTIEQGPMEDYTGTGNQTPQNQGFNEDAYYNDYMNRYKPSHTAQDYYNQLMMQYPTRDMHPGIMRRLAASFSGFGAGIRGQNGYAVGQSIMDEPFNEKLADWKNRMAPALSSANLERYENVNERQLLGQEAARATAARREDIHQQDVDRRTADDIRRAESRQANLEFRYWKQQHPNHIVQEDKQGYLIGIDPQTNKAEPIFNSDGERMLGSKLPEETRMGIQHGNRMEEIGAQGANAADRADEAGWGTYTDENGNPIDYNVRTGQTRKSGLPKGTGKVGTNKGGVGGKQSSFQDAQKQRNIARQILNTDPDSWKWIRMDQNQVVIDPDHKYGDADPQTQAYVRHLRDTIYAQTPELPIAKNDRSVPGIDTAPEGTPVDASKRVAGVTTKTFPNGNKAVWDGKNWRQIPSEKK